MARVALVVGQAVRTGLDLPSVSAEVDGNSFNNTGQEILIVQTQATPIVVTVLTPRGPDGQAVTNRTVAVAASKEIYIGPFPPEIYNQRGSLGDIVHVDYDVVTDATVQVLRC